MSAPIAQAARQDANVVGYELMRLRFGTLPVSKVSISEDGHYFVAHVHRHQLAVRKRQEWNGAISASRFRAREQSLGTLWIGMWG
nr:hypothetical protein [Pseudarthrobacter siccitolerans]